LKDSNKRHTYDSIYPSIARSRAASAQQSGTLSESAQIAALRKSIQERATRWQAKKTAFDIPISELQEEIRQVEQEIQNLKSFAAADAAEAAWKKSWGAWFLSPILKKAEDNEEDKARKDRWRQERRIEQDMKERRLDLKKARLEKEESLLRNAKGEFDAANQKDNSSIQILQSRMWAREAAERKERMEKEREKREAEERAERERVAEILRKWQEEEEIQAREAAEISRKYHAQTRRAKQKRREEQYPFTAEESTYQSFPSSCTHGGWWAKLELRKSCPECGDIWSYLLQCPGCSIKACPKCQSTLRPRRNRGVPPRARTTYPDWDYD